MDFDILADLDISIEELTREYEESPDEHPQDDQPERDNVQPHNPPHNPDDKKDTPNAFNDVRSRFANRHPAAHQLFEVQEVRKQLLEEMTGCYVGPMPPEQFLEDLMRPRKRTPRDPPDSVEYDFSNINGKNGETAMYQQIVSLSSAYTTRHSLIY